MHVLRVAGIDYRDGVAIDAVGVVPTLGVRHIEAFPSADGGFPTEERVLDAVDGEDSVADIAFHVLEGISVAVLAGHIAIERADFAGSPLGEDVFILHLSHRKWHGRPS